MNAGFKLITLGAMFLSRTSFLFRYVMKTDTRLDHVPHSQTYSRDPSNAILHAPVALATLALSLTLSPSFCPSLSLVLVSSHNSNVDAIYDTEC